MTMLSTWWRPKHALIKSSGKQWICRDWCLIWLPSHFQIAFNAPVVWEVKIQENRANIIWEWSHSAVKACRLVKITNFWELFWNSQNNIHPWTDGKLFFCISCALENHFLYCSLSLGYKSHQEHIFWSVNHDSFKQFFVDITTNYLCHCRCLPRFVRIVKFVIGNIKAHLKLTWSTIAREIICFVWSVSIFIGMSQLMTMCWHCSRESH